jgi:FAD/FMN-containing dehydrogenase
MTTITATRAGERSTVLDLESLRADFASELLTPTDGARYDDARAVFNAMFDRHPTLIARPTSPADVVAALRFARSSGVLIAVRGGAHSVAGYSTVDDGIVIDLSAMRRVVVDANTRRVRVQAGATWGEVDRSTQEFGLATTGGRMTTTGVAGFTLGSGSGWLERLHGWACDNLVSASMVTADGQLLTASEFENPDLFWGLRGGGGNFGIVTEFEFQLHPIGPIVLAGLILHPRHRAPEVLRFYRDFMIAAPREVAGGVILMHAPPAPFVPATLRGRPAVAIIAAYFGPVERGMEVLAPLRAFGAPPVDLVRPMPYVELQAITDPGNPPGRRNYWRSENLATLPDEAIDALIACAATATSPASVVILAPVGGAVTDTPPDATALANRAAPWLYHCYGIWTDTDDAHHIAWVRASEQTMRPWSATGISMNFVSEPDDDRIRTSFGAMVYPRLVDLKNRYDPDNLFRMNQNVRPTVSP